MAEHEGNALLGAQVGEPVPGEHALDGDDQAGVVGVVAEGSDRVEESAGIGSIVLVQDGAAALIEDAQVHASGVQIDAAVESVALLVLIETHRGLLAMGGRREPASWLERYTLS